MILSDRDRFIGVHVAPEVKIALRIEASRRSMSMSAFINEIICEKLDQLRTDDAPQPLADVHPTTVA